MTSSEPVSVVKATKPRRNVLGIISFVLGILVVLTNVASQFTLYALQVSGSEFQLISTVLNVFSTIQALVAIVAVALGIFGLLQRGRGVKAAVAGIALGGSFLFTFLVNIVLGAVFTG